MCSWDLTQTCNMDAWPAIIQHIINDTIIVIHCCAIHLDCFITLFPSHPRVIFLSHHWHIDDFTRMY